MPFAAVMGTCYPATYMRGQREMWGLYPGETNFPRFSTWLGQNSSSGKQRRLLGELHTRMLSSGNVETDRCAAAGPAGQLGRGAGVEAGRDAGVFLCVCCGFPYPTQCQSEGICSGGSGVELRAPPSAPCPLGPPAPSPARPPATGWGCGCPTSRFCARCCPRRWWRRARTASPPSSPPWPTTASPATTSTLCWVRAAGGGGGGKQAGSRPVAAGCQAVGLVGLQQHNQ